MLRTVTSLVVAGTLGWSLGACGDDGPAGPERARTTTVTAPAAPAIGGPSVDPVVAPARNRDTALLSGVRAAEQPGFDRVVFEFRGTDVPGYDVRYVPRPITADGSGEEVAVAGTVVLQVRMENALDADLEQPGAPETYTGPRRIAPRLPAVTELVRVGGFEGVLTWAIGTRRREGFVVSALQDPPRLVVDVATG